MMDYRKAYLDSLERKKISYPPNHKPVLEVPKGGSSCANCKYVSQDKKQCSNTYFIQFNGSNKLPYPANSMCSDWWEGKDSAR